MAEQTKDRGLGGLGEVLEALPTDRLLQQARELATAAGERAVAVASDKVAETTGRLADYVERGGRPSDDHGEQGGGGGTSAMRVLLSAGAAGVKQMVGNKLTGGGGGGGKGAKLKVTNIVEEIEVGVPVRVAYNQWTQFQDFPRFTKRLESVSQESDEKLKWKAGIFLSHRTWESTIIEQVPDELIVWRSQGEKGSTDGTVTFHELTPNLTKILLVLEYHPKGLFERTGNLWRAQGRRTRLELKHFRRHVMTRTILDPDGVEGWRGEIRDSEVVRSHEDALEEEEAEGGFDETADEPEDEDEAEYDAEDDSEDEREPRSGEYDEEEEPAEEGEDEYDEEPGEYDAEDQEDEDQEEPEDDYAAEEEWEDEPDGEDEEQERESEDEQYDDEEEPAEEYAEDEYDEDAEDEDEEPPQADTDERPAPRARRRAPARVR
ncbi:MULTISPECIES: SRPBCC family protein [unclassified Kitasatospora]|uniref:SRPBCC family protein n=1 Tax=unclassified Kitasatospora TaxID=2633591 RepID=UPI0033C55A5B